MVAGANNFEFRVSSNPDGYGPRGWVHAWGDPDEAGPLEPFDVAGPISCLRIDGNRAAFKFRLERAAGSAEQLLGWGFQVFAEDNGKATTRPVDKNAFDPPVPPAVFELTASQCDDPGLLLSYDTIRSGDMLVHDVR